MNHQKIYDAIIEKAQKENRKRLKKADSNYIYYEKHHIVPKCLNGCNEEINLVLLTAREHFVCHKLLTYIYPNNRAIFSAFYLMVYMNKKKYNLSSRDYAYARELRNNIPLTEETRKKLSNVKHPNKGLSYYEFYIEKYGEEEGIKKYEEYRIRNENKNVGDKNPMFGKKQKAESIEKNKKSQLYNSKNFPQWLKDKIGEKSKGENNPMYGKTFYEIWVKKFGKEEADKKLKAYKENKSNKIRVRNIETQKVKVIKPEELDFYLKNGWEKGGVKRKIFIPCKKEAKIKIGIKRSAYIKKHKDEPIFIENMKKFSKGNKERIHIFNIITKQNKNIKPEELETYLNDGWKKGMYHDENYIGSLTGKIWIHTDILSKNTVINKENLDEYLKNGWLLGMIRYNKNKN